MDFLNVDLYSSPSILQTSILRPPLIIRPFYLVPKGNFLLNDIYFKTTCNIRPHFLGLMGGLKIEGPLYIAFQTLSQVNKTYMVLAVLANVALSCSFKLFKCYSTTFIMACTNER